MERRNLEPILPFLPREAGLRAHVLRVAALAGQAAHFHGYSGKEIETLEWAALLHHYPVEIADHSVAARILEDIGFEVPRDAQRTPPEPAFAIVRAFRGLSAGQAIPGISDFLTEASALLEGANFFDEQFENLPYEDLPTDQVMDNVVQSGILTQRFARALRSFRTITAKELFDSVKKLPVFPRAAFEALRIAADPLSSLSSLEQVLSKDPVLVGEMIQLANSGSFGSSVGVTTVPGALARVGTSAAVKLIAAAAARRCFASSNLHELWAHSFKSAETAAQIAADCGRMDPGAAFLAGLVHDVGRMSFELSTAAPDLRMWQQLGFPVTYAEYLISGTDHASMGGEILKAWNFPDELVDGVLHHHRPELTPSRLAAAIYAGEDLDETLPSMARDHLAVKRLDVTDLRKMQAAS